MNRAATLALALAPGALALVGLVAREERTLARGVEVVLEVRPYDPQDLLAGRYLATPLAIERIDSSSVALPEGELLRGAPVLVGLARAEPCWFPIAIVRPGEPREGAEAWIAAVVDEERTGAWTDEEGSRVVDPTIELRCEVDRFYVPENAIDPTIGGAARELRLVARVARDGRAAVVDLLVDGLPYSAWQAAERR